MAKRDEDIRKFRRASEQRLKAAELLFEYEFFLEATYIAGYAIECILKHLILRRMPRNRHDFMLGKLTGAGAKGHDFDYLMNILRAAPVNCNVPREINVTLRLVSSWSTELRYEVGRGKYDDAREFLGAAQNIAQWVERS